jgi:hypothetical protein
MPGVEPAPGLLRQALQQQRDAEIYVVVRFEDVIEGPWAQRGGCPHHRDHGVCGVVGGVVCFGSDNHVAILDRLPLELQKVRVRFGPQHEKHDADQARVETPGLADDLPVFEVF